MIYKFFKNVETVEELYSQYKKLAMHMTTSKSASGIRTRARRVKPIRARTPTRTRPTGSAIL